MTFDQIELCAKCIYKHKIEIISMVMEPIGAAFGSKEAKKKLKAREQRANKQKNKRSSSPEEREAKELLKLRQLKALGIDIQ